jgi:hypothetical protein
MNGCVLDLGGKGCQIALHNDSTRCYFKQVFGRKLKDWKSASGVEKRRNARWIEKSMDQLKRGG